MITKDVKDGFSQIKCDADKPGDVLAEDKVIGSLKLGIGSDSVRITPAAHAYAE